MKLVDDGVITTGLGESCVADMCETAGVRHSGQASALYAFASSGTVTQGLAYEAKECLPQTENAEEVRHLDAMVKVGEELEHHLERGTER